jgi:transposase InsO family protein
MGPIKPESLGGSQYVLVVLDDYSPFSQCCFVESKAEIGQTLLEVAARWERQTGSWFKILRTGRGTEFCNTEVDSVLTSKGLQHQLSVRYTPQQNGRVERVNRALKDRARALVIQSKAPKKLLAEALSTAN